MHLARTAQRTLDVQYYIWHEDLTGRLLAAELLRAAERGVRVRVLIDDLDARDKHESLAVTDLGLPRQSVVGGASIYPFVQNLLLAARNEGLGSLLATLVCRQETELREVFAIPASHAVACLVAMGRPRRLVTKLSRRPVESFARQDRFDGPPLARS